MFERIVDLYAFLRAERQTLLHQVHREWVRIREERLERAFLSEGQCANVFA